MRTVPAVKQVSFRLVRRDRGVDALIFWHDERMPIYWKGIVKRLTKDRTAWLYGVPKNAKRCHFSIERRTEGVHDATRVVDVLNPWSVRPAFILRQPKEIA